MPESFSREEVRSYYKHRVPGLSISDAKEYRGPYPIHLGTRDSFGVEGDTGRWFCQSACARGGDIISLERELTNVDFTSARDEVLRIIGRGVSAKGRQGKANTGGWRRVATYIYTGASRNPLFRAIRLERGKGPFLKIGAAVRYRAEDVRAWLETRPIGGGR